ncbi:MAG: co-chaperone GroES [bacterium]|nr:co-chaperone GroES [bacterium]
MAVPIKPLADYVVAVQDVSEAKTASGLYLPDNAKEKPQTATVEAVGKSVKDVKAGDRIIYGGYSNTEVKMSGKTYLLIKEENIYATVK